MYDNLLQFHDYFFDAQRIPLLIIAFLFTSLIGLISGPLSGNVYPFIWQVFDFLFGKLGDRLNRVNRGTKDLIFRGVVFALILLLFALISGKALAQFTTHSAFVEGFIVIISLTSGTVWFLVLQLYFVLEKKKKGEAAHGGYYALARSSRVDFNKSDDYGIAREALALSAVSFDKGLVAPGLWYLIGGVPFLLIYNVLSFASWRFGACGFSTGFGRSIISLEKLMGYVPSLFAGVLYTAASVVAPSALMLKGFKAWWQAKDKVPYAQGGVILSALAWPLEISLGGPVFDISGKALGKVWIGPEGSSAKLESCHLKRGLILNVVAHLIYLLVLSSAYLYSGHVL